MSLTIATWNVNSVKSRLQHLLDWLKRDKPDIVLLQEIKCTDDAFPCLELEDAGYNLAIHGEKTYNGVAILSRFPLSDVTKGLPGNDGSDMQSRYIEAVASLPDNQAIRVASVYVPNGQEVGSDKYNYKLRFLSRLDAHVKTLRGYDEMLAIGGDYNVAPDDADIHNPGYWKKTVLAHQDARDGMRRILHQGMYNALRVIHPAEPVYSWWDYRAGAYERDDGLLIDHILLSPQAADRLIDAKVEKEIRALEKASDHAPVMAELAA